MFSQLHGNELILFLFDLCAVLSSVSSVLSVCCCLAGALCALPALVLSIWHFNLTLVILMSHDLPSAEDTEEAVQMADVSPPNAPLNNLGENIETTSGRQEFGRNDSLLLVNVRSCAVSPSGHDPYHTLCSSPRDEDDNAQKSSADVELVNTNATRVKDSAHNQSSPREESGNNGSVLLPASREQINQSYDRNSIIIERIRPRTLSRKLFYPCENKILVHVNSQRSSSSENFVFE